MKSFKIRPTHRAQSANDLIKTRGQDKKDKCKESVNDEIVNEEEKVAIEMQNTLMNRLKILPVSEVVKVWKECDKDYEKTVEVLLFILATVENKQKEETTSMVKAWKAQEGKDIISSDLAGREQSVDEFILCKIEDERSKDKKNNKKQKKTKSGSSSTSKRSTRAKTGSSRRKPKVRQSIPKEFIHPQQDSSPSMLEVEVTSKLEKFPKEMQRLPQKSSFIEEIRKVEDSTLTEQVPTALDTKEKQVVEGTKKDLAARLEGLISPQRLYPNLLTVRQVNGISTSYGGLSPTRRNDEDSKFVDNFIEVRKKRSLHQGVKSPAFQSKRG